MLGLVTALGGGAFRDVILGPDPALGTSTVFWIRDANYIVTATVASVAMFFIVTMNDACIAWAGGYTGGHDES